MAQLLLSWQIFLQFQVEDWGVKDNRYASDCGGQCFSDLGRQLPKYG